MRSGQLLHLQSAGQLGREADVQGADVRRMLHEMSQRVGVPAGGDIGRASRVADFSCWAIAQDFGAISPTTRWTKVTTINARTNPATSAATFAAPIPRTAG